MRYPLIIISFLSLSYWSCKSNTKTAPVAVDYLFHHELRAPTQPISVSTPALILMHGYGSNEKDLLTLAQHIDPSVLVICPRAPITLMENKYSWYPLNRKGDDWAYEASEVLAAKDKLLKYITQLEKGMGISSDRICVGGFSQGAIMSLTTGLLHPSEIGGIISLSGELYPEIAPSISALPALKDLKVFISHGLKDQVLLPEPMKQTATLLQNKGVKVTAKWYPSAHTISNDNYRDLLAWIKQNMLVH